MRNVYCASLVFLFFTFGSFVRAVQAQDHSSLVVQGSVGARDYWLESFCGGGPQNSFGGSIHYYLTQRTSVGGEFLGFSQCKQLFTYYAPKMSGMAQIAHDFSGGRVRPYVIGGVGFINHASQYVPAQTKLDAAAGGGAKFFVTKRIYFGPEAQFAVDGTIRGSINVGFFLR